jgi:hypothetical protein
MVRTMQVWVLKSDEKFIFKLYVVLMADMSNKKVL